VVVVHEDVTRREEPQRELQGRVRALATQSRTELSPLPGHPPRAAQN
jgi:hypothetical protein